MKREALLVDNISEAVKQLITYYFNTGNPRYGRRHSIVYFDGWDGTGASAVLTAVSNLPRSKEFNFDRVVAIDFSKSESRRSLQRSIAEQLKLGTSVMNIFHKQDEDDDFSGVEKISRQEIPEVTAHIFEVLIKDRILVIFRNGTDEEINLVTFGIPVFDWNENKALWTYRWPFIFTPILKSNVRNAHVFLRAKRKEGKISDSQLTTFVHEDAKELARFTKVDSLTPDIVMDCWFYLSWLSFNHVNFSGHDEEVHVPNFWVCDGIIKGDGAWEDASSLFEAMRLEHIPSRENKIKWFEDFSKLQENRRRWISMTPRVLKPQDMQTVPKEATCYFFTMHTVPQDSAVPLPLRLRRLRGQVAGSRMTVASSSLTVTKAAKQPQPQPCDLPTNLFHHSGQLRVLKLSSCAFSFVSPPFLCCHNLRFLWIDSCSDNELAHELVEKQNRWISLKGLWVLDIRHTNWAWILTPQMMELMVELKELNVKAVVVGRIGTTKFKWPRNLCKFRVVESPSYLEVLLQDSLTEMENLELLDLSGNSTMEALPNLTAASRLKVLILDGCDRLHNVEPGVLPLSLESFSFDGFGPASRWKHSLQIPGTEERPSSIKASQKPPGVSKISLQGLVQLKNVFLRRLPDLEELNLSDTAVQALDLEAMQVPHLERLFLLGCEKLRRVQWRDLRNPPLKLLCVDTRGNAGIRSMNDDCQGSQQDASRPLAHIVVTDVRFLRGFMLGYEHLSAIVFREQQFHLHLSSTLWHTQVKGTNKQNDATPSDELSAPRAILSSSPYLSLPGNIVGENNVCSVQDCVPPLPLQRHIEISEGTFNMDTLKHPDTRNLDLFLRYAESLLVHDHSSITTASIDRIKGQFANVRWCVVERCPKMHTVFHHDRPIAKESFQSLETFRASHLLQVQCIWSREMTFDHDGKEPLSAFGKLRYLHLHSCPSLKFVLPWPFASLPSLETIYVTYCDELRQIFPQGEPYRGQRATSIEFPSLKHIHLHELPKLQQICEANMLAPALETIKLKGCWSLRRLPAIQNGRANDKPLVLVDCEKDCWDKLDWDGLEESRNLLAPRHSRYYKMTMLRGTPLR